MTFLLVPLFGLALIVATAKYLAERNHARALEGANRILVAEVGQLRLRCDALKQALERDYTPFVWPRQNTPYRGDG